MQARTFEIKIAEHFWLYVALFQYIYNRSMKSTLFVMCLYENFMYDIVQLIKCNLLQM
jgi:hypothetical protein